MLKYHDLLLSSEDFQGRNVQEGNRDPVWQLQLRTSTWSVWTLEANTNANTIWKGKIQFQE